MTEEQYAPDDLDESAPAPGLGAYSGEVRPRRWSLAVLLNLALPGLGYAYIGRPGVGVAVGTITLVPAIAIMIGGYSAGVLVLKPLVLSLLMLVYGQVGMAVDLRRESRTWQGYVLKPWNTPATYITAVALGWAVAFATVQWAGERAVGLLEVDDLANYPRLVPGDVVDFDRRAFADAGPYRGELVVAMSGGRARILRVIAGPGDHVTVRGHDVLVNGVALPRMPGGDVKLSPSLALAGDGRALLAETELPLMQPHYEIFRASGDIGRHRLGPIALGDDEWFFLSDFRSADHSLDSRRLGAVHSKSILGRPRHVVWSHSRARIGLKAH